MHPFALTSDNSTSLQSEQRLHSFTINSIDYSSVVKMFTNTAWFIYSEMALYQKNQHVLFDVGHMNQHLPKYLRM